MFKFLMILTGALFLQSCATDRKNVAQQVVDAAIRTHGSFAHKSVSFSFRDKTYSISRGHDQFTYTRKFTQEGDTLKDMLVNSNQFIRLINSDTVSLHDSIASKYANSVNSVLYFVQLPFLLNDPAVNKSYQGSEKIKGGRYDVIKVTFDPHSGGEDYQDEYMYWFNKKTHLMDYLAYRYYTEGGGVRFREAYNRMTRDGILFQDYLNYKAPIDTPLSRLPDLFENGKLELLSRIENDNIKVRELNN